MYQMSTSNGQLAKKILLKKKSQVYKKAKKVVSMLTFPKKKDWVANLLSWAVVTMVRQQQSIRKWKGDTQWKKIGKKKERNRQQLFSPANHHHHRRHHHHQQSLDRRRLVVLLPFQCATIIHWRWITKKEERRKLECVSVGDWSAARSASLPLIIGDEMHQQL